MKPVQIGQDTRFDDLPLFHVRRHRHVWESLGPQIRKELTDLLSQLFLDHVKTRIVAPKQRGGQDDE